MCPDGQVAGTYDDNTILNYIVYEVEFPDGQFKDYYAKIIVENMLKQVNPEDFFLTMMEVIFNYKRDDAVIIPKAGMFIAQREVRSAQGTPAVNGNYFPGVSIKERIGFN